MRIISEKTEKGDAPFSVTLTEICNSANDDILECMRILCKNGDFEGFLCGVNKIPALRLKNASKTP